MLSFESLTPSQQRSIREYIAVGGLAENDPQLFCEFDIADGNQSCTHPSVLYVPEGFQGYQWWMSATPFPIASRENPHVWCSNDGMKWVTPEGASNPVMSPGTINGHAFTTFSDPCLIRLHTTVSGVGAAGDLLLVGRPMYPSQEGIYFKTSSDGITWSGYTEMMYAARPGDTGYALLSPSLIQEDDGTFAMWICTGTSVAKYTSSNLTSWTGPTACTFYHSANGAVWHADIKKRDGIYYGLLTSTAYKTLFVTSTDGVTWTGRDGAYSIVPQQTLGLSDSSAAYDKNGQYKGCLIPSPSKPGGWDIWVPQISSQLWNDSATSASGNVFTSSHRIQYFRGIDLEAAKCHVTRNGASNVNLSTVDTYFKVIGFQDNVNAEYWDSTNDRFQPPAGWYDVRVTLQFTGGGAGAVGHASLYKNGTFHSVVAAGYMGASHQPYIGGSMLIYLNGTDYLEVYSKANATADTAWKVAGGSRFQAVKVSSPES